ncbi:MAG: hypothetical protein IJH43_04090 [Mogibacterium sp.]|nr:hypothetical protein [Mogibacterium sp.]
MRAIKNFFHDINDILLAIIIVAIASGIIYWRMGIILDYPKQLAAQQAAYEQEADDLEDAEESDAAEADKAAEQEATQAEPQG